MRREQILVTIAACIAAFIVSIDSFIINVALPTIAGYIGVRDELAVWLLTLFTMPYTLAVPLSGWLCLRFGNRRVFLVGISLFMIGCLLCGFTRNFHLLLFFRILQGMGAGMIIPCSLGMIMLLVPVEKRGLPMSFWGLFVMVGPAMGPVIGGMLSNTHWFYLFWVTIPFSLFAFFVILRAPIKVETCLCTPFDYVGCLLMCAFVGSLGVMLNWGQIYDWFHAKTIVILFLIALVTLPLLIIWELFHKTPFVQLHLFKRRNFTLATMATALLFGALISSITLDVYWTYHVLHYPPISIGFLLLPMGIFPLLLFPLSSCISQILGRKMMSFLGALLFALSFFFESQMNEQISFAQIALIRLLQGAAIPFITFPNAMMIMEGVENTLLTYVISFYQFMRVMISGFFVSIGMIFWIHRRAFYQTIITARTALEDLPFLGELAHFMPISESKEQLLALGYQAIVERAHTLGLADIYYLYAGISLLVALSICFCKREELTKVFDFPTM